MEELRGVIAERFVLSLINMKMVAPKGFLKRENGAVIMDDDTRYAVLKAWQERKREEIDASVSGREDTVGPRALRTGDAAGTQFTRRYGHISAVSMEMRQANVCIDYV
jgi:hypothetical protein